MPGFRAGIRRINADINDLGNFQAPVAHDLKAFAVPRGIGDDVDCNIYVERPGILECFKIFGECDALSVTLQSLLVDCFKTEEHGIQAESLPKFEDLFVAQEHIAARFEIVTFPDSTAGNRFAELHTVLGLNEGYVVHDKNSRFADLRQFLDCALRRLHAVVATIERPRTAKNTVPWTAPAELDGSSRIELAYKIFPAMPNDIARRQEIIQRFHEGWRRPAMIECYAARHFPQVRPIFGESIQQASDRGFAFANQHAIHSARTVPQNLLRNERDAVPSDRDKGSGQQGARGAGKINNFWNIGEIIDRECDNVRSPTSNQVEKVPVRFALQINQTDRVARLSGSRGDKLKTQRLKTKINLRIHQTTRVNCE